MTHSFSKTLALVGIGNWGKNLAKKFYKLGALHTICDSDESLLDHYQSQYPDVHMTSNFDRLLKNKEIDKIAIATPAEHHAKGIEKALLANKDVFVEKPLCLSYSEGEKLEALAQKQQKILMVGHLYHYHPAIIKLKELIQNQEIGEIKYIAAHRLKLGTFRQNENVLWSFSPHDISVILTLNNDQLPTSLECQGSSFLTPGVHDIVTATLQFENRTKSHIFSSWVHPFKEQKFVIVGTKAIVTIDDTKPYREKLSIQKGYFEYSAQGILKAKAQNPEYVPLKEEDTLLNECEHFLTCSQKRTTPKSSVQEGLRVLKVLEECQKKLSDNQEKEYFAHKTAIIEPNAHIGKGTHIWHFSNIKSGAIVGKNCNLGQNVVVFSGASLGVHCKVQNNVSIYAGVTCEDHVFLGPSMVFTNVKNPRCEVSRRHKYQQTLVRKGATIGANATIVCGVEIGKYSFIAAGAVVTKNTKPFSLMQGSPARQVGWMSRHGCRLNLPLTSKEEVTASCPESGQLYTLIDDCLEEKQEALCKAGVH